MKNLLRNKNFIFFLVALGFIIVIFNITNSASRKYSKNDVVITFEEETVYEDIPEEEILPEDVAEKVEEDTYVYEEVTEYYDPAIADEVGVVGNVTYNQDINVGINNEDFDYTININDVLSVEPNSQLSFFATCGYMDDIDVKIFTYFLDTYIVDYTDTDIEISDDFYNVTFADYSSASVKIKGTSYQVFKHTDYSNNVDVYIKDLSNLD